MKLMLLEIKFQSDLNSSLIQGEILKNKLIGLCEDKATIVRTNIATESKNRFESIEQLKECLESDFPKFHESFKQE